MIYRVEWWTGREWQSVAVVYRSLGRRAHQHPVDAFAAELSPNGPKRVLTARLRATPCPTPEIHRPRFKVRRSLAVERCR